MPMALGEKVGEVLCAAVWVVGVSVTLTVGPRGDGREMLRRFVRVRPEPMGSHADS